MTRNEIEWYYPPSEDFEGLQPNLGFELDIKTLMRESIQNSLDERIEPDNPNKPCQVKMKLIALNGMDRNKLLETLQIEKLKKHILTFNNQSPQGPY